MRKADHGVEEEKRIIRACAEGDWEEFSLLFEKYRERVYFLALSIVKERATALDVAQNTFIKVFKSLKHFNRRSRFSTWIFRITYNQALDQYRKTRRRGEVEYIEAAGPGAAPSSGGQLFREISERELGERALEAVGRLPLKLRTAVLLKHVEGLTYTEICEIIGCARGVLQKRLKKANEKLREMLRTEISELHEAPETEAQQRRTEKKDGQERRNIQ